MRVLFLIPPSVGQYFSAQVPHTGIAYLSAILKKNGIETKIIDMRLGYSVDDAIKFAKDFNPDIIGATLYSYGFIESMEVLKAIKESVNATMVLGGPHVSAFRKEVLETIPADYAIKGEGEYTLLELCKGKKPKDVLGLIWRDGKNIIENPDRPFITDLDSLPLPSYEDFELEKYLCYDERHLPIVTSRGCPYQCIFCTIKLSMGKRFRPRSPENVVNEIEYWYKKGWKSFEIHDDNFTLDIDRAEKICDLIISKKMQIRWKIDNGIRADRVTRNVMTKMKNAGCHYIAFGIETGTDRLLNVIKKGEDLKTIINAVKLAKEAGMTTSATFIIGHPTETFNDFMETFNFAKSLDVDNISFYNLVPYQGTELFEWVEKHGKFLFDKKTFLYNIAQWKNEPIFETSEFTREERKKAYKIAYDYQRKKLLQFKLGKKAGYIAWKLTSISFIDNMARKTALSKGFGRKIFDALKMG